ncbi:MAG: cadherin-like beta sandwich domain-containing protein [Paludibacteraceae bacterium]|nr:cadherin-like beta sandwich domain-containing protein [Paludibacteraceae bacterium]
MKRLILSVLTAVMMVGMNGVMGQYQLTNSGFDTYESDALHNTGERPTGWQASNVLQFGYSMTVLTHEAGRSGQCAKLENVTVIGETSPAWITLGNPWADVESLLKINDASAGTDGGLAFTHRPDTMALWIKRTDNGSENAYLIYYAWTGTSRGDSYMAKKGSCVPLTHYDEESDIRRAYDPNACGTAVQATQVAEGHWINNTSYSNWTEIKVPIEYISNVAPEKINIILSAGNYPNQRSSNIHQGSKLWVDDLRLIYSSVAHEILLNNRKMTGFSSDNHFYTYSLGENATTVPTITLKRSKRQLDPSEYTINYGAVGDTTTVTIYAEDGSSQTTYKILFTTALSTNSRLADIMTDGVSVPNFRGMVYDYNIELPFGSTDYPEITYTKAEAGQMVTIDEPQTFPGTVQVTCQAEDRTYSTTYNLNFTVGALNDNTLTDIQVNGKTITGFSPTKNSYVVELPIGTTGDPVITYSTNYPNDQTIVITNNGIDGGATITVTPNGTSNTRTYRLTFRVTASTYAYLASLKLDGAEIDGFDPEVMTYRDTLPIGTSAYPAVTWEAGDEYQVITVDSSTEGLVKVTVTAQAGNTNTYRIYFTILQSDNNLLESIMVDGVEIEGFDPMQNNYVVHLEQGETRVPVITWLAGDEYQEISLKDGGLTGQSKITVKAGNGQTRTYMISFTVQMSGNSKLADLKIDGTTISGWNPDITSYHIVLPQGTREIPEITWIAGDEHQTIRMTSGGLNGETRITVKAQDGSSTVYVITFEVTTNSDTHLNGIFVGGELIEGFNSETTDYEYTLPGGTTVLPQITYTKGDESQSVAVARGGVNGVSIITVVAEDGSRREYKISFNVEKSANAMLRMIYVDGDSLEGFSSDVLDYSIIVPVSATSCPQITADKEDGQQVTIIVPSITGMVKITVTPETGAQNVYTINVHYPQSSNTQLSGITVDGNILTEFNAEEKTYNLVMTGTQMPDVVGVAGDELQTVWTKKDYAASQSLIYVKAENGDTAIYTLRFSRTYSSEATLENISLDGTGIEGFNKNTYNYIVTNQESRAVAYVLTNANAKAVMTIPAGEGRATIDVTSEDGTDSKQYTIDFVNTKSGNADLTAVTLNGVAIPDEKFVNDTAVISLAYGASVPVVGYVRGENSQNVCMTTAGKNGAEIIVVAEDGTTNRYVVRFDVAKNSNAKLADLNINGFNQNITEYNIQLPWRTRIQPVLQPVPEDGDQTISIDYGGVNGLTTITVTAADGVTQQIYKINYNVKPSAVTYLEDIYYDGAELPAYDWDKTMYVVTLPYGTKKTPKLTWDLALASDGTEIIEQRIEYKEAPIGDTSYIKVTAENGDSRVYRIYFKTQETEEENLLDMIYVGNAAIDGFSSERMEYNIYLPIGTTEMPEISYTKRFAEQRVEIISDGADGDTKITVNSGRAGDADKTYIIHSEVMSMSGATLRSISIDGVPFTRFNQSQTSYIVPITELPEITFEATEGATASIIEETSKKTVIEVTLGSDREEYTLYYYYSDDVIPNKNFTNWEKARYKGSKPVGWMTPGDVVGCYKWTFLESCTGQQASSIGNGINLSTTRNGDADAIYGSIPGMVTTGTMSMNLTSAGNSTSSVGGSIPFRNTPEALYVEYNPIESQRMNNWRMVVTMGDGSNSVQSVYSGSFNGNDGQWHNAELPVDYTGLDIVSNMNIILNSGHSENANDYGGVMVRTSTIQFQNLHFVYNSRLSGINIDGTPISGFSSEITDYELQLDAEYNGYPRLSFIGEVEDQEHQVRWTRLVDGNLVAVIHSVGEDGEQYTDYTITFNKAKSTNNKLGNIKIGGVVIAGFNPDQTKYYYTMTADEEIPDFEIVKGNSSEEVNTEMADSIYTIRVTSESGSERVYQVVLRRQQEDNAKLRDLSIEGHTIAFDAETTTYGYTLGAHDGMPLISFEKATDRQTVTVNDSMVTVLAADGSTKRIYHIDVTRIPVAQTSSLTKLTVDDEQVEGFSSTETEYSYDVTGRDYVLYSFEGNSETDKIVGRYTKDAISVRVNDTEYHVTLVRAKSSDDKLAYIKDNGRMIADWDEDNYDYIIIREKGETSEIEVSAKRDGTTLSADTADGGFDITAMAEDGTTHVTHIAMSEIKGTSAELQGIYLNGELIKRSGTGYMSSSAFKAAVTDYDITLESSSPKMSQPAMPSISVEAGEGGQVITIAKTEIMAEITVRSETGVENVYTLNFSNETSDNTMLNDIAVDFHSIEGFDPLTRTYVYAIGKESGEPEVTYEKGDAFQNVSVNNYGSGVELTVTAESGAMRTYSIAFLAEMSNNAYLNNILLDGATMEGFDPQTLNYTVGLPIGTVTAPTVTIVAGDDGQNISINEGGLNNPTSIVVTAEDGTTIKFYNITFDVERSDIDTLRMIYVNGEEIHDFRGEQNNYSVAMEIGETVMPMVTFDMGDEYQSVMTDRDDDNMITTIMVTADNGRSRTYTISFHETVSRNSMIGCIYVDGDTINDFAGNRFTYRIMIEEGATRMPEITWSQGDRYQTVSAEQDTVENVVNVKITVTAGDGMTQSQYYVTLEKALSGNSYLNSISLNGSELMGFEPETFVYTQILSKNESMPFIDFEGSADSQTYETVDRGIEGGYEIRVTAENGSMSVYVIRFEVEKSHNALLGSIEVNGEQVSGFDAERYEYTIVIPYGQLSMPAIGYVAGDEMQRITMTLAKTAADSTLIIVTAEDGIAQERYIVTYEREKCSNAYLSEIRIGGELLSSSAKGFMTEDEFDKEVYQYDIVLPYGTLEIPEVTYKTESEDIYSVTVSGNDTIVIEVVSEDQLNINEYEIRFDVAPSSNALLADLRLLDGMVIEFDPETFDYEVTYKQGTDTANVAGLEDVEYVKGDPGQTVKVYQGYPTELVVSVTAEDGQTINVYRIEIKIDRKSDATLKDIIVNGQSISGFNPEVHEYTYYIYSGEIMPEIVAIANDSATQTVDVTIGFAGDYTHIYVTAEDGTEGEYRVMVAEKNAITDGNAWENEVSWLPLGNGQYRASSIRDGVFVYVSTLDGRLVRSEQVKLIDANDDIKDDHHGGGTIITIEEGREYYIYSFVYEGRVIKAGKFLR